MKYYFQREISYRLCDIYPRQKAISDFGTGDNVCGRLTLEFWYGSKSDQKKLELDLSDKAGQEILRLLRLKYGKIIDNNLKSNYE